MKLTVTFYAWWLWPYLAVGAVLYPVFSAIAARNISPRRPAWRRELEQVRSLAWKYPVLLLVCIGAWPLMVWQEVEGIRRRRRYWQKRASDRAGTDS